MAPLSGENFRKYSKAKSIERGVLIIINKAGRITQNYAFIRNNTYVC